MASKTLPSSPAQDFLKFENVPNVPTSDQFRNDRIHKFYLNSDETSQYRKKLLDHDYLSLSVIPDLLGESPAIVDLRRLKNSNPIKKDHERC